MAHPMLRTEALAVGYNGQVVLGRLNLLVEAGEIVALLGRNGAGKTTTLTTLAGVLPPISGTIEIDGARAKGALHARARAGLGFVTEDRAIIKHLTVRENLRLAGVSADAVFGIFPELERFGNKRSALLSGGEQQMLALGRCLAARPSLLLIDELSLGLAPLVVERLLVAVRTAADEGAGILLVEQKAALVLTVADRGYVLGRGTVEHEGSAAALAKSLAVIEESYLTMSQAGKVAQAQPPDTRSLRREE
jgi:branched-chain amino acid transport system ATP-binding protein